MQEDGSKVVHCMQVWRHGRGWKQGGALSAGVTSWSCAVHCLQVVDAGR